MGVDTHALQFLEYVFQAHGPMGATLTAGRQRLRVPPRELRKYMRYESSEMSFRSAYVDDLLLSHFGATSVKSIDFSDYEGADLVRDLNAPLEDGFPTFDSILDAGTLEHIFDVRTAFRNIAECCHIGGQILHILPANNYVGHGFYQFSPEFFFSLYSKVRGFDETEVFLADLGRPNTWWQVSHRNGSRSMAMCSRQAYVLVRTRKIAETSDVEPVQQSDYVHTWRSSESASAARSALKVHDLTVAFVNRMPSPARARLLQVKRRIYLGIHSRNPSLSRVQPPRQRLPG